MSAPFVADALGDDRRARIRLGEVSEPGNPELALLVAELGAVGALEALHAGSFASTGLARVARRLATVPDTSHAQWRAGRLLGARFVCPGDGEWPAALDDLAHVPPHDGAGGPPLGLWVRGACALADRQPAVAVVGSRAASDYGLYVAGELSTGLAEAGVRVLSGAAYGVDGAAHRGALAVAGCTLAVLASGVDVPYPRSNATLLDDIVRGGGLIVSEAPLGARPSRSRFLVRNRLIAALALGTVVVEAANRSGALNTAAWAEACSRQTMAVPGPVTSALSAGTHGLVRDRGATLVCSAAQVLEAIRRLDPKAPDPAANAERASRQRPRDALTLDAAAVLDALPGRAERGVARLCRDTGLSMPVVLATLAELDIAGFVERGKSGWRLSADERRRIREQAARAADEAGQAGA